jgi:hypothetical protein
MKNIEDFGSEHIVSSKLANVYCPEKFEASIHFGEISRPVLEVGLAAKIKQSKYGNIRLARSTDTIKEMPQKVSDIRYVLARCC